MRSKNQVDRDGLPLKLRTFLSTRVAKFWVPEYWAFVKDIPKTSVGKIDKKLLREQLVGGQLAMQKHLELGERHD